jgi:transcriptional pleiotropic regulator of transition state genes
MALKLPKERLNSMVKSTGIVRKLDELGRIVLPIELRRTLDINEKDELEIYVDGRSIILTKNETSCTLCGSKKDIVEIKGKSFCQDCINLIKTY